MIHWVDTEKNGERILSCYDGLPVSHQSHKSLT